MNAKPARNRKRFVAKEKQETYYLIPNLYYMYEKH